MGSVVALILVIFIAYIFVMAGGTAYELTGIERSVADFQALSAFTSTGFTTRESERMVNHPLRRRITGTLIVGGYASAATVIATLVSSVNKESVGQTALNMAVLLVVGAGGFILIRKGLLRFLEKPIRAWVTRRFPKVHIQHEDLLTLAPGFGIARLEIMPGSPLEGRKLAESGLRIRNINVLSIERADGVNPNPSPDMVLLAGDQVVAYGPLSRMDAAILPPLNVQPKKD
jgi:hypothetical protein